jgi:glycosyltransferase involved in cell wall biosynthesis
MSIVDKSNIKIVFFHLSYVYSGGGEKLALKEIDLLRQSGYSVDCYAPLVNTEECYPDIIKKFDIKEIIPGLTKLFWKKPEIGVILTCLIFPFISWKFRKYTLVIGANQPAPFFGYILKLFFSIPYIIYLAQPTRIIYPRPVDIKYGIKLKYKMRILPHLINIFRPLFFWIDLKSITCSNIFMCNGIYMQSILGQIYSRIPIVNPAGTQYSSQKTINSETFTFRNTQFSKPFLLMSNRHFPHKKFEYAIEALSQLKDENINLLISGEPTYYTQELKKIIQFYNLSDRVHFLGYATENELESLYANCSIYLYTAPEEDFGMGIIEAMGHGKPVICWDNAGPGKIINNGHDGILATPYRTFEIAHHITELLTNQSLYQKISKNALLSAKEKYSWEQHLHKFATSIDELTAGTYTEANNLAYASENVSLE